MSNATAIILSGGKSTRMGVAKESLKYNDTYLLDIIISNLKKHFDEIIVVTNNKDFFEKKFIKSYKEILITSDIYKEMGPCAGLHSGLFLSSSENNYLYACDMPYTDDYYIEYLKSAQYNKALVFKGSNGYEPFQAMYKKTLIKDLESYLKKGKRSLNGFLREINPDIIDEKMMTKCKIEKIFKNLNYQEDWKEYVREQL